MSRVTLILVFVLALLAITLIEAKKPAFDQVEKGVKHAKTTIKSLGPVNPPLTESEKKIRTLTAPKIEYYHEVQATVDAEVDRTARAIIDNPSRQAYRKRIADLKKFTKTVKSAGSLLKNHNKLQPAKPPPIKQF